MVFLMETKQNEAHCERIRREVGMDHAKYVNLLGEVEVLHCGGQRKLWYMLLGMIKTLLISRYQVVFLGRIY